MGSVLNLCARSATAESYFLLPLLLPQSCFLAVTRIYVGMFTALIGGRSPMAARALRTFALLPQFEVASFVGSVSVRSSGLPAMG